MIIPIIALLLLPAFPSAPRDLGISITDDGCPCRYTPEGRDIEECYFDVYPENLYGGGHVAGSILFFGAEGPLVCYYLFDMFWHPAASTAGLFPEARLECAVPWADAQAHSIALNSSLAISYDGRYVIPYCYGMTTLHIYEIVSLHFDFRHVRTIPVPTGVEAVSFFKDHLIVLDRENLNAYSMHPGRRFQKEGDIAFPHDPYQIAGGGQIPIWMRNMVMDGDYLYLLNGSGNDLGPILTFSLGGGNITLVHDGREFIVPEYDEYPLVFRVNLQLNEAHGNKYLMYFSMACRTAYTSSDYSYFRLEKGIPLVIHFPREGAGSPGGYCDSDFLYSFKNDFRKSFSWYVPMFCAPGLEYFGEDEQFHDDVPNVDNVWNYPYGMYQGPDTEHWNFSGRSVGCSTDDLPSIEHFILPNAPVSGNFLVMGRATDSEGIRRVFAGYPLCVQLWRASLFQQQDGSAVFMAVIPEVDPVRCAAYWTECPNEGQTTYMPLAEDADGDSNQSPDAPWANDFHCIQFKNSPDPMPEGEVEASPCGTESTLVFSGLAVDNSGIRQGWLLSEDAQVLIPLAAGLERPDIAARYPDMPDSLHAGFTVTYDTAPLPDGTYEFTIRLVAHDYQVLDFGPYSVSVDRSHSRPVTPP
jgi:hypothetical protein